MFRIIIYMATRLLYVQYKHIFWWAYKPPYMSELKLRISVDFEGLLIVWRSEWENKYYLLFHSLLKIHSRYNSIWFICSYLWYLVDHSYIFPHNHHWYLCCPKIWPLFDPRCAICGRFWKLTPQKVLPQSELQPNRLSLALAIHIVHLYNFCIIHYYTV